MIPLVVPKWSLLASVAELRACFIPFCRASVIHHDHYTVPAATAELGLLYITSGRLEEAQRTLEAARSVPPCMQ